MALPASSPAEPPQRIDVSKFPPAGKIIDERKKGAFKDWQHGRPFDAVQWTRDLRWIRASVERGEVALGVQGRGNARRRVVPGHAGRVAQRVATARRRARLGVDTR